jgi:hypothetical protein
LVSVSRAFFLQMALVQRLVVVRGIELRKSQMINDNHFSDHVQRPKAEYKQVKRTHERNTS